MSAENAIPVEEAPGVVGDWQEWFSRLESLAHLKDGWNSYAAPAPGQASIVAARSFLLVMQQERFPPTRIAPSVMGGVGITCREEQRKVYIEFYNDGTAHALFSDGLAGMNTRPVPYSPDSARAFLSEMRNYLHG